MGKIVFRCPETGRAVPTGIEMTEELFQATFPSRGDGIRECPACGGDHQWEKKDAWVETGHDQGSL